MRVHVLQTQTGSGSNGALIEQAGQREGRARYANVLTARSESAREGWGDRLQLPTESFWSGKSPAALPGGPVRVEQGLSPFHVAGTRDSPA